MSPDLTPGKDVCLDELPENGLKSNTDAVTENLTKWPISIQTYQWEIMIDWKEECPGCKANKSEQYTPSSASSLLCSQYAKKMDSFENVTYFLM